VKFEPLKNVSVLLKKSRTEEKTQHGTGGGKQKSAFFAAASAFLCLCVSARAETIVSRYDVTLAGMPLGGAVVNTALSAQHYRVVVSADIEVFFISRKVQGVASGSRHGENLHPDHFQMAISGGDDNAVDIRFAGSSVGSVKINPPIPQRLRDDRVPLRKEHLREVLDPLSALLVTALKSPAPSGNPCNGVLPIFNGYERFDISLRPKQAGRAGMDPTSVTCQARYTAIAGHQRSGGSPQNLIVEVNFKRLPGPNLWVLQSLSLPTAIGTVIVSRAETRAT
jgi:hypothetical protein